MKLFSFFIAYTLCFCPFNPVSGQDTIWTGYGRGIDILFITKNEVIISRCNSVHYEQYPISGVTDSSWVCKSEYYDKVGDEKVLFFEVTRMDEDTSAVRVGENPAWATVFFHPHHRPFREIQWESLELEIMCDYAGSGVCSRIEFNKYGLFRISDGKNFTLYEQVLDSMYVAKVYPLIEYVDIRCLNECSGWRNSCNDGEIGFTFVDDYRERYSYFSVICPLALRPLYNYMHDLVSQAGFDPDSLSFRRKY